MKFNDEHKEEKDFNGNYLGFGVHKVKITKITLDETTAAKEFMEITVQDEKEAEDSTRVWFTTDAAINYAYNTLLSIFIHNTAEAKRDEARQLFKSVPDTPALAEVCQTLVGKEAWFTKYYSVDRTYLNSAGETKRSVDKNIYGYEPKLKPELMPTTGAADLSFLDKVMPGAKEVPFESPGDAAGSVPAADKWSS